MSGGGSAPRQDTYAQNTYARINRDLWNDYQTRYVPRENELIGIATDRASDERNAEQAGQTASRIYEKNRQGAISEAARYGGMSPDQRGSFDRKLNQKMSLDTVDSMNKVRDYSKDRRASITGSLADLGRETRSEALSGFSSSAQREAQRNQTNRQIRAQNRANLVSGLATAGTLAMLI